jgi:ferritin-like metal-binding protein YciE
MTEITKRIDQWLRDAHAMEQQAETILKGQSSRIKHYPELSAKFEAHLEETRRQRERLERCMERRGTSTSGLKDAAAKFTATMQNLSGLFMGDEIVKGVMAGYTFEHMEIASYRILSAAARADGDTETARVCDEICKEEEAMAAWLQDHMGSIATQYLQRDASGEKEAKR